METLRAEHDRIRRWLTTLSQKVEAEDTNSDHEEWMLFEEMLAHNGREEYALYPELDSLLSNSEKETLYELQAMSAGVAE